MKTPKVGQTVVYQRGVSDYPFDSSYSRQYPAIIRAVHGSENTLVTVVVFTDVAYFCHYAPHGSLESKDACWYYPDES